MKFTYKPKIKKQANNPFLEMPEASQNRLHAELRKRLLWLCQLSSSSDARDQEFYAAFTQQRDHALFGRSPEYQNAANTGISVLAGAVEKLYAGDLSMKQLKYITPLLQAMSTYYPKQWEQIDFVPHQETASTFLDHFDA